MCYKENMEKTKATVIIPAYNQEILVIRAIDSIPKRDDIEIIVIDDCSTDKTLENVKNYSDEHKDQNIRIYHNEKNRGVGFTVNRGYDLAKGEYVVLLGSDDYFYSEEFSEIMKELDGTDLVYFNLKLNDGSIWKLNNDTKHNYCGSVKFMRREFISETRCPEMRAREDWYFYQELLKKNPTEKFTDRVVKHYNFPRENSLTWIACNGFKNGK